MSVRGKSFMKGCKAVKGRFAQLLLYEVMPVRCCMWKKEGLWKSVCLYEDVKALSGCV